MKVNKIVPILVLFVCFVLFSCSSNESPEIEKTANINIDVSPNPIVLIWYPSLSCCVGQFKVTVTETGGQRCTLSNVKAIFHHNGSDYESATNAGGAIAAFGSFETAFEVLTVYAYSQIRVSAEGGDPSGHSVDKSKVFNVSYVY